MKLYSLSWVDDGVNNCEWFSSKTSVSKAKTLLNRRRRSGEDIFVIGVDTHSISVSVSGLIRFLNMISRIQLSS
jgi:hypothetical protein